MDTLEDADRSAEEVNAEVIEEVDIIHKNYGVEEGGERCVWCSKADGFEVQDNMKSQHLLPFLLPIFKIHVISDVFNKTS